MTPKEMAQTLALQAVAHISQDEDMLRGLLSQSGVSLNELKQNLTDDHTLAGVLDFLLNHEDHLLNFCSETKNHPQHVVKMRQQLPGGDFLWDG